MKDARLRFAPSPTGSLHIGGARTALFNYLLARKWRAKFILRIEDSDAARNVDAATSDILDSLRWLSLDWHEGPEAGGDRGPYFQSQRHQVHDQYFARLEAAGLVYEDEGAARFRGPNSDRVIEDLFHGEVRFCGREEPDMTIRRADGSYIFHFVNVVDDITMGITHVLRGDDHLANTARHLDLYEAFGAQPPVYGHMPLILNPDGGKMGKRDAGASLKDYRDRGFAPDGVVNYLALLGWSPKDDREVFSRDELAEAFDPGGLNQANARFHPDKCEWFSGQHIRRMPAAELRESATVFLSAAGIPAEPDELGDGLLTEAAEKIRKFEDLPQWLGFLFTEDYDTDPAALQKIRAKPGAAELLSALAGHFEALSVWDHQNMQQALKATATETGVKKGALMLPCRVAVSGQSGGLGLFGILDKLGQDSTVKRICTFAARL